MHDLATTRIKKALAANDTGHKRLSFDAIPLSLQVG